MHGQDTNYLLKVNGEAKEKHPLCVKKSTIILSQNARKSILTIGSFMANVSG
jgi:hypothetical protein